MDARGLGDGVRRGVRLVEFARTATQDSSGRWKWPALTGVVVLAFTAWRIRSIRGLLRERRADGAANPVPA